MIELKNDGLVFTFPEVHAEARLEVAFQRTLRIPDDGKEYPLPPGLGRFPLRHVDDFADRVPEEWLRRGGVMLPMYQSEALWVNFQGRYPFAVKIATGKIDAVTGKEWSDELHRDPQDYMVPPDQPWLDGYCVEKGVIRQFVAMPLGSGYSVEEQITGKAEHGGIQIIAYPMKAKAYNKLLMRARRLRQEWDADMGGEFMECLAAAMPASAGPRGSMVADMGLAPGGRMRQEIYDDPYKLKSWDGDHRGRCFVHLANSLTWRAITGGDPPTVPFTAEEYTLHGLPWFEWYGGDRKALEGAERFKEVKSVVEMGAEKGDVPVPENVSVDPQNIVHLRQGLGKDEVREGRF